MSTFDINLKSTFSKVNIMSDGYVTKIFSISPKPHRRFSNFIFFKF